MSKFNIKHCQKHIYGGQDGSYSFEKYQMEYCGAKPKTAYAFILVGYCSKEMGYYKAMIAEAKKSFPDLDEDSVTCGEVLISRSVKGFTLISFPVENSPVEGWDYSAGRIDFGY